MKKGSNHSDFLKTVVRKLPVEASIIEGCKNGENAAMQQLYHLYIKKMKGMVYRYARTNFDTEDILQEGFIRVFKNIQSYNYLGSFEGWVKRIIINTAINYYKKNIKLESEVTLDHVSESVEAVEMADNLSIQELHTLINKMPEGYRFVLNLYAIEGYSHKEIAEMLQITESTSSSQYFRAKQHLVKLIKENQCDE